MTSELLAAGFFIVLCAFSFAIVRTSKLLKFSLGKLEAEFQPNGGSSLRDAIDRLTDKVDGHFGELFAKVDEHTAALAEHGKRLDALENPPKPRAPRPRKKAA